VSAASIQTVAVWAVPETGVVPWSRVNVAVLIVRGFITLVKVPETVLSKGTPVAPSTGSVETKANAHPPTTAKKTTHPGKSIAGPRGPRVNMSLILSPLG
jgi:hypothetical protein